MLEKIYIKNYVLIKELLLPFEPNFNVLTGETGAGKSIILGALSLILGERADSNALYNPSEKCIIEGHFNISKLENCQNFLRENDLDIEPVTIIRREINAQGKSRAFINDSPVNLQLLNSFTSQLVDLHRQFDNLAVRDQLFPFEIVDALAHHKQLVDEYKSQYKNWVSLQQTLQQIKDNKAAAQRDLDFKKFLLQELEEYDVKENEIEELTESVHRLSNAEDIRQNIQGVVYGLVEDEQALIHQLKKMTQSLQQTIQMDNRLESPYVRLNSVYEELKDVGYELQQQLDHIDISPEQLAQQQDRLNDGFRLLKKHNLQTTEELIVLQKQLASEIGNITNIDDEIITLEKQIEKQEIDLKSLAETISNNRKKYAQPFEEKVTESIRLMGMKNAHFKVELAKTEQLQINGIDNITFTIDSNNSGRYALIQKSASGGELSRIMLAIKTITAQDIALPTLIFDEVDTGISGESAKQVGALMKELGQYHQIICITHQPQVAAKAHHHYFVYKKEDELGQVNTSIQQLGPEQRIKAIARMIGGDNVTEAALNNAKELMA